MSRIANLPKFLKRKIYKTGQTRGADDDEIYQNRVNRNSTVLIPYACWEQCKLDHDVEPYEKGFIVLLSPSEYFCNETIVDDLHAKGLTIGVNALVFYETKQSWIANNPDEHNWTFAQNRTNPLGGQYVARIPATTAAQNSDKISLGFNTTKLKGAGIRVYEYASSKTIKNCRLHLEALFWLCCDAVSVVVSYGMTHDEAVTRKTVQLEKCRELLLLDSSQLCRNNMLNTSEKTICPLCREELSAQEFFNIMKQAEGRFVPDITITQVNLFHIDELRIGDLNHHPYNVGWGHHHCNVVAKDSGIRQTLEWMRKIVNRNIEEGYLPTEKNVS